LDLETIRKSAPRAVHVGHRIWQRCRGCQNRKVRTYSLMGGSRDSAPQPQTFARDLLLSGIHARANARRLFSAQGPFRRSPSIFDLPNSPSSHSRVGYVSYQEQWLDSTGPFKDVMISMFARLAKQERARISERTIAELKVARAKGKRLGRPPLPKETIRTVLSLNEDAGTGARKIARSTGFRSAPVSAILTRSRQQALLS
jgi:hypothetical protein